jgi:hypothetical protein
MLVFLIIPIVKVDLYAQVLAENQLTPAYQIDTGWMKVPLPTSLGSASKIRRVKVSEGLEYKQDVDGEFWVKPGITNRLLFHMEINSVAHPYFILFVKTPDYTNPSPANSLKDRETCRLFLDKYTDRKLYIQSSSIPDELYVLWENTVLPHKRSGKVITIYLPTYIDDLENSVVRLYSTKNDQLNKELIIPLQNGKPVHVNESFSGFNPYYSPTKYFTTDKLKVFIDCRVYCDENYIKSQIKYVDFVIDRLAADIHILITSSKNGSGGNSNRLLFFGQHNFTSKTDTLNYNLSPNATEVEKRNLLTDRIHTGLIPFLSKSPSTNINESMEKQVDTIKINSEPSVDSPTIDKWNYWVYKIGADGSYNVDQNYQNTNLSSYFSANRTTDKLKVNFSLYANNQNVTYTYDDNGIETKYRVINRDYELGHYLIKSLSEHWSIGYQAEASNSTFLNYKSKLYLGTGIEFAIFPYKAVHNKYFTINYVLDLTSNNYYEMTIFDKTSESLLGHKIEATLSLNQKWGYINGGVKFRNYFKDWKLNNLLLTMDVNIRITGGLSFYVYSNGSLIHDQVYLVKGNATVEEILTRKRQLASTFNFYSGAGISYRFGSILNNFVNPRFSL